MKCTRLRTDGWSCRRSCRDARWPARSWLATYRNLLLVFGGVRLVVIGALHHVEQPTERFEIAGVRCRINILQSARGVGFAVRLLASFQAMVLPPRRSFKGSAVLLGLLGAVVIGTAALIRRHRHREEPSPRRSGERVARSAG